MKVITVGWDKDLPLKALLTTGTGDGVKLATASTSNVEGDVKSRRNAEEIAELIRRGGARAEVAQVPLAPLAEGLRTALEIVDTDSEVFLAGGPRLLNILVFTAAIVKRAKTYAVPEYGAPMADITPLSAISTLPCIDDVKAAILSTLDDLKTQSDIAKASGRHHATVSRNLNALISLGLVEERGGRPKKYAANLIARIILPYRRAGCK